MSDTTTQPATAHQGGTFVLEVPGATVTYDVRGDLTSGTPLFLIGSPMDASGFGTLAGHFTDRPVVTYDPRGATHFFQGCTKEPRSAATSTCSSALVRARASRRGDEGGYAGGAHVRQSGVVGLSSRRAGRAVRCVRCHSSYCSSVQMRLE